MRGLAARPEHRPARPLMPALGVLAVSAAAVIGLAGPQGAAAPVALLGALLVTARGGRRWGSAALVVIAACAFIGRSEGRLR